MITSPDLRLCLMIGYPVPSPIETAGVYIPNFQTNKQKSMDWFKGKLLGTCFFSLFLYFSHANWWYTYPPEKYESQIGSSSQLLGKIKNVPNHQPAWNMGLSCTYSREASHGMCRWRVRQPHRCRKERPVSQVWSYMKLQYIVFIGILIKLVWYISIRGTLE